MVLLSYTKCVRPVPRCERGAVLSVPDPFLVVKEADPQTTHTHQLLYMVLQVSTCKCWNYHIHSKSTCTLYMCMKSFEHNNIDRVILTMSGLAPDCRSRCISASMLSRMANLQAWKRKQNCMHMYSITLLAISLQIMPMSSVICR